MANANLPALISCASKPPKSHSLQLVPPCNAHWKTNDKCHRFHRTRSDCGLPLKQSLERNTKSYATSATQKRNDIQQTYTKHSCPASQRMIDSILLHIQNVSPNGKNLTDKILQWRDRRFHGLDAITVKHHQPRKGGRKEEEGRPGMQKNGKVSGGGNIYNADWIHIIILYISMHPCGRDGRYCNHG